MAWRAASASEWPGQPMGVRDAHAAEPDVIARLERMDVEAGAGPRFHALASQQPLGPGEIVGQGDLEVAVAARGDDDVEPGPFADRGIVGEVLGGRRGLAMGGEDLLEPEALRRLRREELSAVLGADRWSCRPPSA